MSQTAISVRNVSKDYILNHTKSSTFKSELSALTHKIKHGFQTGQNQQKLKALKNVSFDINKGETVGIIGRNGAGKSTLLNILSEITPPTTGIITFHGTLTSILGVGTGFHPDLSGKDNIYLNGSILGLSKDQINERVDAIIQFSGLQDFINTPVKHYSDGMYLRLAFAIFAHLNSEILLLDEVLAVGDTAFRRKCKNLFSEMTNQGATIVLVSHNISEIMELCDRCIYLSNGEIEKDGTPIEVAENYLEESLVISDRGEDLITVNDRPKLSSIHIQENKRKWAQEAAPQSEEFIIWHLTVQAKNKEVENTITTSDAIDINLEIEKITANESLQVAIHFLNIAEVLVLTASHAFNPSSQDIASLPGVYCVSTTIPAYLLNAGLYTVSLSISKNNSDVLGQWEHLIQFRIELDDWEKEQLWSDNQAAIRPKLDWNVIKVN